MIRRTCKIFVTAFLALGTTVTLAQEKSYESMSMDEIEALPIEEQKKLPLDAMLALSGMPADTLDIVLMAQLGALFYSTERSNVEDMVRRFQRDIGNEETGRITVGEMEVLEKRSSSVATRNFGITGLGSSTWVNENRATASGTWMIVGEKIAQPYNRVNIECYKRIGVCLQSEAYLDMSGSFAFVGRHTTEYEIIDWTSNQVTAKSGDYRSCRSTILTLTESSKETSMVTQNNNLEACEIGEMSLELESPRITKLVSSFDRSLELGKERDKEIIPLLSAEYQALQKKTVEAEQGTKSK